MKRAKERAIETFLQIHMMDARAITDASTGEKLPYLVTPKGEVYRYPYCKVIPYLNSEDGQFYINIYHMGEHHYPLAQLVAQMFVPRPEGANIIEFKTGHTQDLKYYRADNMEWVVESEEPVLELPESRCPYGFIKDDPTAMAKLCWCRARQDYSNERIAEFFNMSTDDVINAIHGIDEHMRNVFKEIPIRCKDPRGANNNRRLREIDDFIVYLINIEPLMSTAKVCSEVLQIVTKADYKKLRKRINDMRRMDDRVFNDHRKDPDPRNMGDE